MLNFDDLDLIRLKAYNDKIDKEKSKIDMEKVKFYNSRYSKYDLSDFILVDKKPRKSLLEMRDKRDR